MDIEQDYKPENWREITGAESDPNKKMITLLLACGHRLKLRTDTSFGQSFLQTEWKAAQCYQCNGNDGDVPAR